MTAPVFAQDNLDRGKTAQQIFASDCSICHKSPQGLAKAGGLFGLQGFLREHYTASRETANLLARYLEAAGEPPAPADRRQQRRTAKPSDSKPAQSKPADVKPAEGKPEPKPEPKSEVKPAEPKPEAASAPKPEGKPESKPEPKDTEIKSGIAVTPADKPKSE